MSKGWISLHRSIQDHWLYNEKRTFSKFEAWMDILMSANHSDKKVSLGGELFICKRGQSLNSLETWATAWGWGYGSKGKTKVRRFLKTLQDDGMIEVENIVKTTRLTVKNYEKYQYSDVSKQSQTCFKNVNAYVNGKTLDNQQVTPIDETEMKRKRNGDETEVKLNNNVNKDLLLDRDNNTNTNKDKSSKKSRSISPSQTESIVNTARIKTKGKDKLLHEFHKLTANGYKILNFPQILTTIKALEENQIPEQSRTKLIYANYALGKVWEKMGSIISNYQSKETEMLLADSLYLNHIYGLLGLSTNYNVKQTGSIDDVEQEAVKYAIGHCQKQYGRESDWTPETVFEKVASYASKRSHFQFQNTHRLRK